MDDLRDLLARRMRGERITARFDLMDDRLAVALDVIASIVQRAADADQRRIALDQLGAGSLVIDGHPQAKLSTYSPAARATLTECTRFIDRALVASWEEAQRLRGITGMTIDRIDLTVPARASIQRPLTYTRGSTVVVYAPDERPELTALLVWSLEGLARRVVVIGDRSLCKTSTAEAASDPLAALASAGVVVIAAAQEACAALALAALGAPLAVSTTSGAREYLDDVATFEPWNRRSILAAVSTALGLPQPTLRASTSIPPLASAASAPSDALVSLIVRTKDRPAWLRRALASCAAQTHERLEVIVVNDAGANVDAIVAEFPFSRVIENPTSLGPTRALVRGCAEATGEFIGILDDDDVLAADHCERLTQALVASGAVVAHSNAVSLYARANANGGYALSGLSTFLRGSARPDTIFSSHGIAPMTVMMHRAALEAIGGYDPEMPFAEDWELLIRMAQHHDVVHVPAITAGYTIRDDGTNMMSSRGADSLAALARMQVKFPIADRPNAHAAREAMIGRARAQGGLAQFPPPAVSFAGEALV